MAVLSRRYEAPPYGGVDRAGDAAASETGNCSGRPKPSAANRPPQDFSVPAAGRLNGVLPAIAVEFVIGITVRTMQSAAEGQLKLKQVPLVVAGILRAIGLSAAEAHEVSSRLGESNRQKS